MLLVTRTSFLIMMTMMMMVMFAHETCGKLQAARAFEDVASYVISVGGKMAELVGESSAMHKQIGIEGPFANFISQTSLASGAAWRNDGADDDQEEWRRKRSVAEAPPNEETLRSVPFYHQLLHRSKRSPCHSAGGGSTGGTDGAGAGAGDDGGDIDLAERRRRAIARRRKAAARKRAKTNNQNTNTRKSQLVKEDGNSEQVLTRRKRESEVDDLNRDETNAGNAFSEHAQRIAEKIRGIWDGFVSSMNELAQKVQQHFRDKNATIAEDI